MIARAAWALAKRVEGRKLTDVEPMPRWLVVQPEGLTRLRFLLMNDGDEMRFWKVRTFPELCVGGDPAAKHPREVIRKDDTVAIELSPLDDEKLWLRPAEITIETVSSLRNRAVYYRRWRTPEERECLLSPASWSRS